MRKKKQLKKFSDWFFNTFGLSIVKIHYINCPYFLEFPNLHFESYQIFERGFEYPGEIFLACDRRKKECLTQLCNELVMYYSKLFLKNDRQDHRCISDKAQNRTDIILAMWHVMVAQKKRNRKQFYPFDAVKRVPQNPIGHINALLPCENAGLNSCLDFISGPTMLQCRCPQCLYSVRVLRDSDFRFARCPACGADL